MNQLDFAVVLVSMLGIALYGIWTARETRDLSGYLRGDGSIGWTTIGLSVMATQASAITFISTPGQGYESGIGFVQNYFGMPLALIVVSAVFLPMYRQLDVYTAYEYLGRRFDSNTRLLGAGMFLLQRGLAAGITIYAPAIIVSTMFGLRLDATIVVTGVVVTAYTVAGGSRAVSLTQKWQMAVIFFGMVAGLVAILAKLPEGLGLGDTLALAGAFGKLEGIDFSLDPDRRYTFWSGLLGGFFLSLSYFGTDHSQVQRYLSGGSLTASRLGLMFNAILKIPMQAFILGLGALLFVFYQFERPPLLFNRTAWGAKPGAEAAAARDRFQARHVELHGVRRAHIEAWTAARRSGDAAAEATALARAREAHAGIEELRVEARKVLLPDRPGARTNDADYVFVTFILDHLPHGLIGLLVAAFAAASLSSNSAELSALGSTTAVDFYRHLWKRDGDDVHHLLASRVLTLGWGVVAIGFALFANLAENLIQAVNIVGSLFYGVVLGLFLVAFFLPRVGGRAVFRAALLSQTLVLVLYFNLSISYLWYNLIGCAACMLLAMVIQAWIGPEPGRPTP